MATNHAVARKMTGRMAGLAVILAGLAGIPLAVACPIPVFQFALEHWPADPYEARVVLPDGAVGSVQPVIDLLDRAARGDPVVTNVTVTRGRDLAGSEPRLELRYPEALPDARPVWTGPLTEASARTALNSPAREEIARLLLNRVSAVWVLLEGGDRRRDAEAAAALERELPRLEASLTLPDPATWSVDPEAAAPRIAFRMVRVRRDDPAESALVRSLLGTEPDLDTFEGQPIVFPIYGRGRALYALVGDGINAWTIRRAAQFLIGPCSCTIKANNPGTDLLMAVDWEARVERISREDVITPPAGLGTFLDRQAEAERRLGTPEEDGP